MRHVSAGLIATWLSACGAPAEPSSAPIVVAAGPSTSSPSSQAPPPVGPRCGWDGQRRIDSPVDEATRLHAVVDLDLDGHLDAVVGRDDMSGGRGTSLLGIAFGDGEGRFGAPAWTPIGHRYWGVTSADLDHDERPELVAVSYGESRLRVLSVDPTGTLSTRRSYRTQRTPSQVEAVDLTGDGHIDLVVTYLHRIEIWLGDGTGALQALPAVTTAQAPEPPAAADYDADGHVDLFFAFNDARQAAVYWGHGDGTFDAGTPVADLCDGPFSPRVADFDSDGRPDVAQACLRGGQIDVFLNAGGRAPPRAVPVPAPAGAWLAVGDVTADGSPDIVGIARGHGLDAMVVVEASDGAGGFEEQARIPFTGQPTAPRLVDLDHDGGLDVVSVIWPGRPPGVVAVWPSACAR